MSESLTRGKKRAEGTTVQLALSLATSPSPRRLLSLMRGGVRAG
ncbi:hypothetical protein QP363_04420 [Corynebacterium sp. UMB6689]|nr:hypothetical protein [Corynebacterium sp. UMB6689]MDK6813249.1 hypothetical protein [Corynebacterium sp. UMB6689]